VRLRDVQPGDVDAYARMRCDPVMMAELGGPVPRQDIEDKVRRDVAGAAAGTSWIKMIIPGDDAAEVAGSIALWRHDAGGGVISEIGWMVLPGLHAFPSVTNAASNGICRAAGFRLARQQDVTFAGHVLRANHWIIDPQADLNGPATDR
jgi:hypothetical protein